MCFYCIRLLLVVSYYYCDAEIIKVSSIRRYARKESSGSIICKYSRCDIDNINCLKLHLGGAGAERTIVGDSTVCYSVVSSAVVKARSMQHFNTSSHWIIKRMHIVIVVVLIVTSPWLRVALLRRAESLNVTHGEMTHGGSRDERKEWNKDEEGEEEYRAL